jgi:hypothetical protein
MTAFKLTAIGVYIDEYGRQKEEHRNGHQSDQRPDMLINSEIRVTSI